MSNPDTEDDIVVVGPDDALPGKYGRNKVWLGDVVWRQRQRDGSVILYHTDIPMEISNLRVDGIRGVCVADNIHTFIGYIAKGILPNGTEAWRVRDDGGKYIWGSMHIDAPNGCVFSPSPALLAAYKNFTSSHRPTELEKDVLASESIRLAVRDIEFAKGLYGALSNSDWHHSEHGRQSLTWRAAARIVATLRDAGETYMDFYGGGNEGTENEEASRLLEEAGWSQEPKPTSDLFLR